MTTKDLEKYFDTNSTPVEIRDIDTEEILYRSYEDSEMPDEVMIA